jgi:winged helix DNA-binding protein
VTDRAFRVSARSLNRTLLHRQGLLERSDRSVADLVHHLVGLQAQDNLPPYLSLAARLFDLDPYDVSRALRDRSLVRLLTLRGTIHLLTPADALGLKPWTQPVHDREGSRTAGVRPARGVERAAFVRAVDEVLADGPLSVKQLGEALAARFPGVPAAALAARARVGTALVQLPPRGAWKESGGVVHQLAERWLGAPLATPDPSAIVRRYLRAFGPASAADVTTWSGVPGAAALLRTMDDLVVREDPDGRRLYDVSDGELVDEDAPAPVRLLGAYDNVWLSHAGRDRVTTPEHRRHWRGPNGALANTVFVDGLLEGLWRVVDGRVEVQPFRALTRSERAGLDEETARVEHLLAR